MSEKWKKLMPGKFRRGVEFFGCMNTGFPWCLVRPRAGDKKFIVCREFDMDEAMRLNYSGETKHKRKLHTKGQKHELWFFDTLAPARSKWEQLVAVDVESNKRMAEEARQAREDVQKLPRPEGVEAALKLGDLGLL